MDSFRIRSPLFSSIFADQLARFKASFKAPERNACTVTVTCSSRSNSAVQAKAEGPAKGGKLKQCRCLSRGRAGPSIGLMAQPGYLGRPWARCRSNEQSERAGPWPGSCPPGAPGGRQWGPPISAQTPRTPRRDADAGWSWPKPSRSKGDAGRFAPNFGPTDNWLAAHTAYTARQAAGPPGAPCGPSGPLHPPPRPPPRPLPIPGRVKCRRVMTAFHSVAAKRFLLVCL